MEIVQIIIKKVRETLIKSLPWSKNGKMKENNSGW